MLKKTEVKRLKFDKEDAFTACNNKYYIEPTLTAARYKVYEKYSVELGYGIDFKGVHDTIGQVINMFNKKEEVQAKAGLYNLYTSIDKRLEDRSSRSLKLCSLFILREGEDPAKYDEKLEKEKIKDWTDEGYAVNDFFSLAFNLVEGLLNALDNASQAGLKEEKKGEKS